MSDPTGGWAKAVEKIGEATSEIARTGRSLGRFLAPAFQSLVGMAQDQFETWRAQRQVRLAERFLTFLRDRGLEAPTRTVSPSFMLPLIERASIEADNDLQDVWAMMLANAADAHHASEMRTAFNSMLGEMTHLDVVILSKLDAAASEPAQDPKLGTWRLPEEVVRMQPDDRRFGGSPTHDVSVSLVNLGRLGCILPVSVIGGWSVFTLVTVTDLGAELVRACGPPRKGRSHLARPGA